MDESEKCEEKIKPNLDLIKKCWSPYSIVYDPLESGSVDGTDTLPHDHGVVRAQRAHYIPPKVKGNAESTLFVGRLSYSTTNDTLYNFFSRYGRIVKSTIIEDIVTGRSKGYGFVEFYDINDALSTFKQGKHFHLDGKEILVDMACANLLPGWVPRRLGGGFGGKKESGQLRFGGRDRLFRKPIYLYKEAEDINYVHKSKKRRID